MTTHALRGSPRRLEAWIFGDISSRLALVGASVDDLGRIGYQEDDGTYWRLIGVGPLSWEAVGSGGSGSGIDDKYYRHVQMSASTTWVIVHGLHKNPAITIVESTGDIVYGTVVYDTGNQVTVTFSAAISGEAYLN